MTKNSVLYSIYTMLLLVCSANQPAATYAQQVPIRPTADAFYASEYEPWSRYLTIDKAAYF